MTDLERPIYLDNAATSFPKPPEVAAAVAAHLDNLAVNPGRSGFDLSLAAGRAVRDVRARLDALFANPARDPDRTIFCANATAALNIALRGICRPGDHVVATVMAHNSVLRPLTMMAKAGGITFDLAPCDGVGLVDPGEVAKRITPRTRLVVLTHASNVCGTLQPVAEVGRLCREKGVAFLVDAAQTAGLVPVDMGAMHADLVAFTGHKSLLGPPGTGGLVVGPDVDPEPLLWGGTGVRSADPEHPLDYPWRLEAGTLNTLGIAGLGAALAWLDAHDRQARFDREMDLVTRLLDGLSTLPRVRVQGPGAGDPTPRMPVVSFTVEGMDPERVGLFLDADWNVAVRTGLQCAPLAHRALGTAPAGSVRVSCGPFNTPACIDRLLEGLAAITA